MSIAITLQTGTRLKSGREIVVLGAPVSATFPTALSLDGVAEILAASAKEDPSMASNLVLNASVLNRQVVAPTGGLAGYDAGTALNITYGPGGTRIYTSVGLVPNLVPASTSVEDAADTILVATFDADVNSATPNYLLGFTCKVAGVNRVINSAARQADNKIIWFTLASAVTPGQAVLLSFDSSLSDILSDTGAKLQSFTDAVVLNHVV